MRTTTKLVASIVMFSGLCSGILGEATVSDRRDVSVEEARALVLASLDREVRKLPGLVIEGNGGRDSAYPAFYVFSVMWNGTPGGSVMVGFFDVDPRTGDVFEGTACGERKSRSLERLQRQIRRRIGIAESDYKALKRPGPYCD